MERNRDTKVIVLQQKLIKLGISDDTGDDVGMSRVSRANLDI